MKYTVKRIHFHQGAMGQHLLECLEYQELTDFPASKSPLVKVLRSIMAHIVIQLFCLCKMPESFYLKIIACDNCEEWYH